MEAVDATTDLDPPTEVVDNPPVDISRRVSKYSISAADKTSNSFWAVREAYRSGRFRTVDGVNRSEIRPTVWLI